MLKEHQCVGTNGGDKTVLVSVIVESMITLGK